MALRFDMNRITQTLRALQQKGRKALVTYIVNGDPTPQITLQAMHSLVAAGADILEIGVPFSDPMAEGPVIQKSHERALIHNVSLKDTLKLVADFRLVDQATPVVLMGYANPVERMGYPVFAELAASAGVDGLLTVDLPPEESTHLLAQLKTCGLESIFLLAPTSSDARIQKVSSQAGGFIYYVSLKGVTGAGHLDVASVKEKLDVIRRYSKLPVMVGFGIKDGPSAQAVASCADGVVVGSALVEIMGSGLPQIDMLARLSAKVSSIRTALDS
jgi:tryptophan synthase alpha chain